MTDSGESRSAIFARNVQRLRKKRDWSQAEVGRRVGLGQSRVAAIEASGSVTIDQAAAFADAFGVPLEMLLYTEPPATRVVQIQRLLQIFNAVDRAREDVRQLIDQITADLPGPKRPGRIITADSVIEPSESE